MDRNSRPWIAGPAALFAGYLMCKGIGAVLPYRWITNYEGSFTGFGGILYWFVFLGTAAGVLHLFGYKGDGPPSTRRDDPWY